MSRFSLLFEKTSRILSVLSAPAKIRVTGKPGSEIQVTGTGHIIKQSRGDDKPTLPNIPTQAELEAGRYEVITVSTDDPDAAFQIIARRIKVLTRKCPDARLVADYTGGTKSMSAALILAAVENEVVNLRLTTGVRTDLKGVSSGMERVEVINVEDRSDTAQH